MGAARIGCLGTGLDPAFSRGKSPNIANSRRAWRPAKPQLWALGALGGAVIALEQLQPLFVSAPTLRAVVETTMTLCALVGAGLFGLSFVHRGRLHDLLLMAALVEIAVVELVSNVVPATIDPDSLRSLTDGPVAGQMFMALALLAAGITHVERKDGSQGRPLVLAAGAGVLAAALAELGGWLLHRDLGVGTVAPGHGLAGAFGHPLGAGFALAAAALLLAAAISMARRSGSIENATLLAGAGILFALGRLNYLVVPTPGIDWVTAGELLGLAAFILILVAALRQEAATRRMIARAAAAKERQRIARDLHDGLAQDLAFIAAHGDRIAREAGEEHPLAIAARRALAVSRGAIANLSSSDAPTARAALRRVADELELRFGVSIAVEASDAEPSSEAREHVVRIAREAIVNAAKGQAQRIVVTLAREAGRFVLRVRDDGSGISTGALSPEHVGFGLRSMTERAASLGGDLTASERLNGGTELEVVFQ
jgi:signal transduction histidine kinase